MGFINHLKKVPILHWILLGFSMILPGLFILNQISSVGRTMGPGWGLPGGHVQNWEVTIKFVVLVAADWLCYAVVSTSTSIPLCQTRLAKNFIGRFAIVLIGHAAAFIATIVFAVISLLVLLSFEPNDFPI
ncbi:MAG: hypothetical protein GY854_11820 [Deltaproteobacteria bacterium]|nr:hypothetical protein [Deltaproteobacteria bacterium]